MANEVCTLNVLLLPTKASLLPKNCSLEGSLKCRESASSSAPCSVPSMFSAVPARKRRNSCGHTLKNTPGCGVVSCVMVCRAVRVRVSRVRVWCVVCDVVGGVGWCVLWDTGKPPCEDPKRLHVCIQNDSMCTVGTSTCRKHA